MGTTKKKILFSVSATCIIFLLIYAYLNHDPYRDFKEDNLEKTSGTLEHSYYEDEDVIKSIFYPQYENETLNNMVKEYVDSVLNADIEGRISYVDYQSSSLFDQYEQIIFTHTIYDAEKKQLAVSNKRIGYDIIHDEVLDTKHVFRKGYLKDILNKVQTVASDTTFKVDDNSIYELKETSMIIYDGEKNVEVPYADMKSWLALKSEHIDTLAPKDVIAGKPAEIDPDKPMIAFTFDDGPNPSYTPQILDILKEYDIRATFFMLGSRAEQNTDLVRRMVEEGQEVANHSYDHSNLSKMEKEDILSHIYRTQDIIFQAGGVEGESLRPPYGAISNTMEEVSPLPFALWNIDSLDWKSKNKDKIKDEVLPYVKDGSVILMHDIYETTASAFAEIVPVLKEQGYQFVTYSQLRQYRP